MADLTGVELHLVDSVDMAGRFMSWLGETHGDSGLIAVDTETGELLGHDKRDALSPWHGRLRLAQIGDGMTGWAIPWAQWNGVFHEAMKKYTGPVAFHNIAFEARWFALQSEYKIDWSRAHDTMIMAQIIDPLGSGALKTLTSQHVDARSAAMQETLDVEMTKNGWTWGTVPINFQAYWAYGALDTVLTCRLWDLFYKDCGPTGPYRLVYDLEMATRRVCTQMELNGAPVDLEYSQAKYDQLSSYSDSMIDWCKKTYDGFHMTSNVQLVRIFEKLGVEWDGESYTPSGQKKADKDMMKIIVRDGNSEQAQLAQAVLNQRKASKLAETYFANFITRNINGRVHPNIRTLGARTGRMSITDPALQTLPKNERVVRDAFIASDDDHGLLTSDLDQVEFRMLAGLSADKGLIDLFHDADTFGGDAFTSIVQEVYGDQTATRKDPRRKKIKGMIYGKLYGAGVAKQAITAGIPEPEMKALADAFNSRYPGVEWFQKQVENAGMQRLRAEGKAYIQTKIGRKLPCEEGKVYRLVNYLIQGGAAEVFKLDLLKLDSQGLTDYFVVPVHDEIVLNVPRADAAELIPIIKECMTTRDGWAVPLTAGCDGPFTRWGEGIE